MFLEFETGIFVNMDDVVKIVVLKNGDVNVYMRRLFQDERTAFGPFCDIYHPTQVQLEIIMKYLTAR